MISSRLRTTALLPILTALLATAVEATEGPSCRIQEWVALVPTSSSLSAVAVAPHLTVAAGEKGTILTSPDRTVWTPRSSPTPADLAGVAYGAGRWVAVGAGGVVLTSDDGSTWSLSPTRLSNEPAALTWGLGKFVAVGQEGLVATSPDGVTWQSTSIFMRPRLTGVACNTAACVAVGPDHVPWYSEDGANWSSGSATTTGLNAVAWSRGQFIAVGRQGVILRSTDGKAWSLTTLSDLPHLTFIASNGSSWLTNWFRSDDGVVWTPTASVPVTAVAGGDSAFVGVGPRGAVWVSADGESWQTPGIDPQAVASNGSSYAVLASGAAVFWSRDGRGWERLTHSSTAWLRRLIAWPGGYMALGNNEGGELRGVAMLSPDGRVWGAEVPVPLPYAVDVAFGGGTFVAVGTDGTIAASSDGTTWSEQPSGTTASLSRVLWDGRQFLVQGRGVVLTSRDGRSWAPAAWQVPPAHQLALALGDELVAIGDTVWTSRDGGGTWLEGTQDLPGSHLAATKLGPYFLTVGGYANPDAPQPATLGFSRDGAMWWVSPTPQARYGFTDLAAGPGGFVAIGPYNTLMRGSCEWSGAAVVPTVAHLDGARGSRWRSDLTVANPCPTRTTFSLEFFERGTPAPAVRSAAFGLDPGVSASYPDLVQQLFEFEGAGILRVVGPRDAVLPAQARTYNQTPQGTFGQDVPCIPEEAAIPAGVTAVLAGLAHSPNLAVGFRTNLGLVNVGELPIEVVVRVFDSRGTALGQMTVPLGARENRQFDRVLAAFTSGELVDASIWVHSSTPGGRFLALASVIDNVSGDPTLVTAR